MNLSVIGTGYVGLVTAACFADLGHTVVGMDRDAERIRLLHEGAVPFHEPGLPELLDRVRRAGRLSFTTDTAEAVRRCEVIFITVGTPALENGEADLTAVAAVADGIAAALSEYRLIVEKSTVPVRTGERIGERIARLTGGRVPFDVACNPEFLREGSAIEDFMHPDRVVLGVTSARSERVLRALYEPLGCPILVTDLVTAELIKHASNAFLAMKISYINAVANICERVGADVWQVADGMGYDRRIGRAFLDAGAGYGGSCFPKDVAAFIHIAREVGYDFRLLEEVARVNQSQRELIVRYVRDASGTLEGRTVGVLGLAFKPDTDDIREAPAVSIIEMLQREGAAVRAYDPVAEANAARVFPDVTMCPDPYEAAHGADALLVLTDWNEFRSLDLARLRAAVRRPVLVDGRNVLDPAAARAAGFVYIAIGRSAAGR